VSCCTYEWVVSVSYLRVNASCLGCGWVMSHAQTLMCCVWSVSYLTYEWVMSVSYLHVNASCLKYGWVMSHGRTRSVTNFDVWCLIRVMSHIWMNDVCVISVVSMRHVSGVDESCPTHERGTSRTLMCCFWSVSCFMYEWVMSVSYFTYPCVMSQVWMSHVTLMNEWRHELWLCHVSGVDESCPMTHVLCCLMLQNSFCKLATNCRALWRKENLQK